MNVYSKHICKILILRKQSVSQCFLTDVYGQYWADLSDNRKAIFVSSFTRFIDLVWRSTAHSGVTSSYRHKQWPLTGDVHCNASTHNIWSSHEYEKYYNCHEMTPMSDVTTQTKATHHEVIWLLVTHKPLSRVIREGSHTKPSPFRQHRAKIETTLLEKFMYLYFVFCSEIVNLHDKDHTTPTLQKRRAMTSPTKYLLASN